MIQFQEGTKINKYNYFIDKLKPIGKFQLKVYSLCVAYWCLAGSMKAIFDICFKQYCPYGLISSQFLGIIILSQLGCKIGHKKAGFFGGITLIVGLLILIINAFVQSNFLGSLGLAIVGFSTISRPTILLCNIAEYATMKVVYILVPLSILSYSAVKLASVFVIDSIGEGQLYLILQFLLPISLISFGLWFFVEDSPRYMIENDINQAEKLIRRICQVNELKPQQIIDYLEESFVIKLINIKVYDYRALFKYNSLGFSQYCLFVMMGLLGLVYDFPTNAMFEETTNTPMRVVWESSFQFIGISTTFFLIKIGKRRLCLIIISIMIAFLSTSMFIIQGYCYNDPDNWCYFLKLITLGLNSVFSITLYIFLIITAIQFYPHSIRVLGLGMVISFFYFGKLMYHLYEEGDPTKSEKVQLFLLGSWILAMHSFRAPQTFSQGFKYQISQIEEDDHEQI